MSEETGTCPCGSGVDYQACCGRLHAGDRAPTAERVMRARYSAYALGDADYLVRTWHPDTRPLAIDLDPEVRWVRLEVLAAVGGGMLDRTGTVEFVAHHRVVDRAAELHEVSRFERLDGAWVYVDPDEASLLG
ncbi:MAG: YchJ family protein [Actinobacteria bacterium]|nr:YchJ family protein [Actinomycetota bacterium]